MKKGILLLAAMLMLVLFALPAVSYAAADPIDVSDEGIVVDVPTEEATEALAAVVSDDDEDNSDDKNAEQSAEERDQIDLRVTTPLIIVTCSVLFAAVAAAVVFLGKKNKS